MSTETTTITAAVAAHVLWSEGLGGYPAGSFTTKLLNAWASADNENAARLATGWPEYAAAFALMQQAGGVNQLRTIAQGGATA